MEVGAPGHCEVGATSWPDKCITGLNLAAVRKAEGGLAVMLSGLIWLMEGKRWDPL